MTYITVYNIDATVTMGTLTYMHLGFNFGKYWLYVADL